MDKEFLCPRLDESSDDEYPGGAEEHYGSSVNSPTCLPEMVEDTTDPDSPQMTEMGASNGDSETDCAVGEPMAHEAVQSNFHLANYDPHLVAQSIFDSISLNHPLPKSKYTQESVEHSTPLEECESAPPSYHQEVDSGSIIYPTTFVGYQASFADASSSTSQMVVSPSLSNCSPLACGPSSPILPRAVQARGGKRKFVADPVLWSKVHQGNE